MIQEGLKDVVALQSTISRIDGEKGVLEYRGYSIHDLALHSTYEEVAFLILYGHLPKENELKEFSDELAEKRDLQPEIIGLLSTLPKITHPMVALRTAISYFGSLDNKLHVISPEENLEKSKNFLAKLPTIVAYTHRIREGLPLIHPDKNLGHAANFLFMLKGEKPKSIEEKALDVDLILHAEHTLNASTFSARIAASTLSDMYAGIVSATGVLMGYLHGGASQGVIETLREIKGNNVQEWVGKKLENKEKIMGFGHRVYRVMDPRAKELKKLAKQLDDEKGNSWSSLSEELAEAVKSKKNLYPNVDFYAASVYTNLGIPDNLFINIFAMSRIVGWTAHMMEQYENNKLIRPKQEYTGSENKKYVPIEER